jgi:hypothetical protein
MPIFFLGKSNRTNKKYYVRELDSNKTVHFGDSRYEDYTQHKDENRKIAYLNRHQKREDWNDPSTAGFWSRWLSWNKPTIKESIKDIQDRFKIKLKLLKN